MEVEDELNSNSPTQVEEKPAVEINPDMGYGEPCPVEENSSIPLVDGNGNSMMIPVAVPPAQADCNSGSKNGLPLSLFTSSHQARIFTVILMNGIGLIAMISEGHIFYRDLEWNWVLDGVSAVDFPTKSHTWNKKLISFAGEGEQLKKFLRRDIILPIVCMVMIGLLIIINILTQTFDLKHRHRYLSWAAGVYAFIGASLLTLGAVQLVLSKVYVTNMYGTVRKTLTNEIPPGEDYVPDALPEGDPISVKDNAEFFYRVFESCRIGNVKDWSKQNELMGIHLKIPSYRQLVQMGFCVNNKVVIITMIILVLLTGLAWLNVFLCLKIWRKHIVARSLKESALQKENGQVNAEKQQVQHEFRMFYK